VREPVMQAISYLAMSSLLLTSPLLRLTLPSLVFGMSLGSMPTDSLHNSLHRVHGQVTQNGRLAQSWPSVCTPSSQAPAVIMGLRFCQSAIQFRKIFQLPCGK